MATIALSAAGMALGGSVGGSVLGLSMATIGRAAGAALGQRIDQQLLGQGSAAVETGRLDGLRLTGAAEGADVQRIYGRMRVAGQVIWASEFREETTTTGGGGKGSKPAPVTTSYRYTVSLAIALCEGVLSRVGRVWADGTEISPQQLNMRLYQGTSDQLPDPLIAAIEGDAFAPAYRGTAYVVLEDLPLGQFGNRIPHLTFEVMRSAADEVWGDLRGVVLGEGTGEYALATSQLHGWGADSVQYALNTHSPLGGSDFAVSVDALEGDLPAVDSVVLPVVWFGDDLRCAVCQIAPMVAEDLIEATAMPWRVSGVERAAANVLPSGTAGTPSDAAVIEAIADLTQRGKRVVLQPLLKMRQQTGNGLPDPWGEDEQAPAPWVGRVTLSKARSRDGTSDRSQIAADEIDAFFGDAEADDFAVSGQSVSYTGPATGGYRQLVLHYAFLASQAGGVDSFLIGTDLAGLTPVRDDQGAFPAVEALQRLAQDVRLILGPDCLIGYAADGDEALGDTPPGTEDRFFPLDQLWADNEIDFVGINLRIPLADWREGTDHADAHAGVIHNPAYLKDNVAGGEGYDWIYPTPEARAAQRRVPVIDPDGEHWVWRKKDLRGWWESAHHPRVGGVRKTTPTVWTPQGKPLWFTAYGCEAVALGANHPDPVRDGIDLPQGSNGQRDDLMQMQYLRAVRDHFCDANNNPVSDVYGARMIDLARCHARHWDVRPFPFFPNDRNSWADGASYETSATLNGRASSRSLASVVAEICTRSGVSHFDVSALYGVVRGCQARGVETGRAGLQPLMLAYGFDAFEKNGVLVFQSQYDRAGLVLDPERLARDPETDQALRSVRNGEAERTGRLQIGFFDADGDYAPVAREAALPDETDPRVERSVLPLALTGAEGARCVQRWLQEARVQREHIAFALPPSAQGLGAGDLVQLGDAHYRISRIEDASTRSVEAERVIPQMRAMHSGPEMSSGLRASYTGPVPANVLLMDLPLLTGDEIPHAPHVAAYGAPWPGTVALYTAAQDSDYQLEGLYDQPAMVGVTETALPSAAVGLWQRVSLRVRFAQGSLSSATAEALLGGANTIAIGNGQTDGWEVMQFLNATPAPGGFVLSGFLRGLKGTGLQIPSSWPVGTHVVVINGALRQLDLPSAARGTARHFRFGPATQPMTDASYRYVANTFAGVGLRPYPVVHLRAREIAGDVLLTWVRCTRVDGDQWDGIDVPLGEDIESYLVRVRQGNTIIRETTVPDPSWAYTAAMRAADGIVGSCELGVAQISARFGAGPMNYVSTDL
ncbi:baseplate multidomain protein megatron [Yoonia litorea]|uniref:Putative phage tail protein n=1 Tax=Yoonia litorea TaxID=1123755 RepID=A0A1I6LXF5_9RHOB|nr:glycoside hydrolase TIM-barrel-like domain-containing protein [Yoonia litorea]SFS08136.1 Putative phage tail protein [Yoonia litorea]